MKFLTDSRSILALLFEAKSAEMKCQIQGDSTSQLVSKYVNVTFIILSECL